MFDGIRQRNGCSNKQNKCALEIESRWMRTLSLLNIYLYVLIQLKIIIKWTIENLILSVDVSEFHLQNELAGNQIYVYETLNKRAFQFEEEFASHNQFTTFHFKITIKTTSTT